MVRRAPATRMQRHKSKLRRLLGGFTNRVELELIQVGIRVISTPSVKLQMVAFERWLLLEITREA